MTGTQVMYFGPSGSQDLVGGTRYQRCLQTFECSQKLIGRGLAKPNGDIHRYVGALVNVTKLYPETSTDHVDSANLLIIPQNH